MNTFHPALRIGLAMLVLGLVYTLGRVGLADFLRLPATTFIDEVQAGRQRPSPVQLNRAQEGLERSARIDPDNPLLPEYLGHVFFQRARLADGLPRLRQGYLEYARNHYREALALRPNSAYLWATLALCDHVLLDQSPDSQRTVLADELSRAIANAMHLGPWEPYVMDTVARVGQARRDLLSAKARRSVDQASAQTRR